MRGSVLIFLIGMIVYLVLYSFCFFIGGRSAFSEEKEERFFFWKWTLAYWIYNISILFAGIVMYIILGDGY